MDAGVKSPLIAVIPSERFQNAQFVAILGIMHSLYVPLNVRQDVPEKATKVERIGLLNISNTDSGRFLRRVDSLQSSFNVCRDVGDTDPQRCIKSIPIH